MKFIKGMLIGEGLSYVKISKFLQGIELWNSFCKN